MTTRGWKLDGRMVEHKASDGLDPHAECSREADPESSNRWRLPSRVEIPHHGLGAACQHGSTCRLERPRRQSRGARLTGASRPYRSAHSVREPKIGEILELPDGSGRWRVVDWMLTDHVGSSENLLIVEWAV